MHRVQGGVRALDPRNDGAAPNFVIGVRLNVSVSFQGAADVGSGSVLTHVVSGPKHGGNPAATLLVPDGGRRAPVRGVVVGQVVLLAVGDRALGADVAGVNAVLAVRPREAAHGVKATEGEV